MTESSDAGISPERARIIGLGASLVIFVCVLVIRFSYTPEEPRLPPRPPPPRITDTQHVVDTPEYYRGLVEVKADAFGVPRPSLTSLAQPFPFRNEEPKAVLEIGAAPLEIAGLRLSAVVQRIEIRTTQGTYERDHLVLHIENLGSTPLAYRITTDVGAGEAKWTQKAEIEGNALAIAAGQAVDRTECLLRSGARIRVDRVEVVELPPLGYHLLSQIAAPSQMGADARTTRHHVTPKTPGCSLPEQTIRPAIESGQASWRDVVDFYARHDCEKYAFLPGYHAFDKPDQYPLPVTKATFPGSSK